jgi:hypothetical protein
MKSFVPFLALCAMFCFAASMSLAADKKEEAKETTLKGTALCGKCELKQDAKCNCILKVKEGDKDVLYYLSGKVDHKADFCQGTKDLTVTGHAGPEKDGHKTFVVTKVGA